VTNPTTEHATQNAILKRFATVSWLRLWRINVGTYLTPDGSRKVKTAPTGFPDLSGILPGGRALFIEVKSSKGRASEEQLAFGRMAMARGAVWMIARSVEDVERVLRIEGYGKQLDCPAEAGPGRA
jgi:hypothetical protein